MLKLYSYWRSTAAYRVRIALNLKRLSYQTIPVHLVKDGGEQHKLEYRAKNPQGLVPLLEHNGQFLSQSMAICEYLDETFEGPDLLPAEPFVKAQVRSVCQAIGCDIHPVNNLRILKYLQGELSVSDEAKGAWYHHWIQQGFSALEQQLSQFNATDGEVASFAFGQEPTLADAFIVAQMYNARRFDVDLTPYPRLVAIEQHCLTLDAFKDAQPESQPDAV
ncbi:maleylacetoacetate isomerase [Kangiella sp. TOML190]|uniref:maleylacetoacetate isomerase n=1 Tax=Kangiella sp. TOML190 TaxID=2931351 RepID=UPI00203A7524|nr:maleylacetoacetate isomerase [Kangiella sp. TOML190]